MATIEDSKTLETTMAALIAARTLPADLQCDVTIHPLARRTLTRAGAASNLTQPPVSTLPSITLGGAEDGAKPLGAADLEIIERIGTGGMGVVDLARQRSLDRDVAIKRPKTPSTSPDISEASRRADAALVREGVITGQLEHPAIVPVHALGRDHTGRPLMVMKRISGASWRALVRDAAHPTWQQHDGDRLGFHIGVLLRVCDAVRFAHSRGVIHRDIKTDNVMIGSFGEVYLLDWGIGIELDDEGRARDDELVGTAGYLAPEMVPTHITGDSDEAREALSVRTDVYLLGATLHEVITGAMRHRGGNLLATLCAAYRSEPFEYDASVPAELVEICNRATARDPQRRYASADELKRALELFVERRSAVALVDAAGERLAQLCAAVDSAEHLRDEATREIDPDGLRRVYELAAECRFALRQALHTWPGLPAATAQLEQCKRVLVAIELDQDNISAAELLLAELSDPPPQLAARLEEARERRAHEVEARAKLTSLERDHDERVGSRRRGLLLSLAAVGLIIVGLVGTWMARLMALSHKGVGLLTTGMFASISFVTLFVERRRLFDTALNRRLVGSFIATLCALCMAWVVFLLLPISAASAAIVHLLLMTTVYVVTAVALSHRLFYGAIPCIIGVVVAMLWRSSAATTLTFANVLSVLVVGVLWARGGGKL